MSQFQLKPFPDDAALCRAAASDWLALLARNPPKFSVAFSGGRIAKTFFLTVVEMAKSQPEALRKVDYFWADERCVPPDSPDSNYLLAKENFIIPLDIPSERIHRLKGELPQAEAVADANATIAQLVDENEAGMPVVDLVFLGIGEDGHTASLMPNLPSSVLRCREAFFSVQDSPKPPPHRLTMSYATLAAARNVWLLATSAGKEEALRQSLKPEATTPMGHVIQSRAETVVYSDIVL